jgi:hypothetical protein
VPLCHGLSHLNPRKLFALQGWTVRGGAIWVFGGFFATRGHVVAAHVWSHSSGRGRKLSSSRAFLLEAPRRRVA